MGIDLKQFHQAFFEESLELLNSMEKALLELNTQKPNQDQINLIFRVIHSIKGSSAAFDFNVMSEFTHTIENYLAQVRDGRKIIKQEELDLLLSTVDLLRKMISELQDHQINEENEVTEIKNKFMNLLSEEIHEEKLMAKDHKGEFKTDTKSNVVSEENKKPEEKIRGWNIIFRPHPEIFKNGNDPVFMLKMLSNLGKMSSQPDLADIPSIDKMNPLNCYIGWNINLITEASLAEVEKVFNWVVDDCLLDIQPLPEEIESGEKKGGGEITKPSKEKQIQSSEAVQEKKTEGELKESQATVHPLSEVSKAIPSAVDQMHTAKVFEQTSIRVATSKIDALINNVGELVITQSILTQLASILEIDQLQKFQEALQQLAKNCHELQSNIMNIRMLPIGFVFDRFHRIVRDLAQKLGKQVELKISGDQTELDKNMMEKIADPLTHLVRNAIDHGIESPQERIKLNKQPTGLLELNAYQQEGNIVITVQDDGQGINKNEILEHAIEIGMIEKDVKISNHEVYEILFQPGFSTSPTVSDLSGRGVGLDAVRKNIFELGGDIEIKSSEGEGTKLTILLPLTLAIMDCQLINIHNQTLAIPLISITEIIKSDRDNIHRSSDGAEMYHLRENYIPMIYLKDILSYSLEEKPEEGKLEELIVVVESNRRLFGLVVDSLLSQQQIVIKSLSENYKNIPGISGATILGDGSLALIVDVNELIELASKQSEFDTQEYTLPIETLDVNAKEEDKIPSDQLQVLIFCLGQEQYGINILNISEILHHETLTPLPNSPDYVLGLINVRGSIVPVIDVTRRLNLPQNTEKNAIIIVKTRADISTHSFGIVVDEVCETYQFNKQEITPVPDTANIIMRNHFIGLITLENKMVTLLRVNNMLPLR